MQGGGADLLKRYFRLLWGCYRRPMFLANARLSLPGYGPLGLQDRSLHLWGHAAVPLRLQQVILRMWKPLCYKLPEPPFQCMCLVSTSCAEELPLHEVTEKAHHHVRAEASLGGPFVHAEDVFYPQAEEHHPW